MIHALMKNSLAADRMRYRLATFGVRLTASEPRIRTMRQFVAAFLLVASSTVAVAQAPAPRDSVSISVTGEGKSSQRPNQLLVQLAVETRSKTASRAGAENADRMTAVRKALLAIGLKESEISTANYNVRMEMYPTPSDTLYVASNSIQIDTRQLELASKIIDASLQAGANQIGYLQYALADPREATRLALANAVDDARLQAEALAKAAGGRLGPLVELIGQTQRAIPYQMQMRGAMAMADASGAQADTPISNRDITVRASVSARWRFVPNR